MHISLSGYSLLLLNKFKQLFFIADTHIAARFPAAFKLLYIAPEAVRLFSHTENQRLSVRRACEDRFLLLNKFKQLFFIFDTHIVAHFPVAFKLLYIALKAVQLFCRTEN